MRELHRWHVQSTARVFEVITFERSFAEAEDLAAKVIKKYASVFITSIEYCGIVYAN